jgi:hypothetical protein
MTRLERALATALLAAIAGGPMRLSFGPVASANQGMSMTFTPSGCPGLGRGF